MDGVCKNDLLSTKRAVLWIRCENVRTSAPKQPIRWCNRGAKKEKEKCKCLKNKHLHFVWCPEPKPRYCCILRSKLT